jgi:hypothetical protein
MDLPYNWDFLQDNLPPEKLAELRSSSPFSMSSTTNLWCWFRKGGHFMDKCFKTRE